jgi:hypothetical protein
MVRIADTPEQFAAELDQALTVDANDSEWRTRVDAALSLNSWDLTHKRMRDLIESRILRKELEAARVTVTPAMQTVSSAVLGD